MSPFFKTVVLTLACTSTLLSHEFMVKPVHTDVSSGDNLPFSAMVAHRLMVSEEVEDTSYLDVTLFENGEKSDEVELTVNNQFLTVDGVVSPTNKGGAIIAGHRRGIIWSNTTSGWQAGDPSELSGVIESNIYEKFCKVQLTVDGSDEGYDAVIGDRLEIVPLSSPLAAEPSDEMQFKILFDGEPLVTTVQAGFDGFSKLNNAYAFSADTDQNGIITVPFYRDGTWFVRVNHEIIPEDDNGIKKHNMRAIYVFDIN